MLKETYKMKIIEVSFKNFSRIYSGLGKTYLHIDLSDMMHQIFLFVGENGSGKTSIMRALHPFAYNNGAGDNTANADFIIEGKDGEKKISLSHDDKRYDVTHIYSRKKDGSISVKSFIQEDGVELNESGTVKTFKDVVLEKLGLDEAFLGLLSLGNTIDGFVKYTAANRKKFATQIFTQLSIYNKYHKTVSTKVRDTKSVLANITTKLERYKSYNVEDLELHKIELESKINSLRGELNMVAINIGSVMQIIQDNEEFIQQHDQKRIRFNELLQSIESLKGKLSTKKDLVVLQNDLESIKDNTNNLKITISGIESSMSSELDLKDSKLSTLKTLQDSLDRMSKNIDLKELTELQASLEGELSQIDSKKLPARPSWSKEDLIKINIYLDELRGMCIDLVNDVNNHAVIPQILKDYLQDSTVDNKINKSFEELTYAFNQEKAIILSKSLIDNMHVRKISSSCETKDSCPYVKFYETVFAVMSNNAESVDKQLQEKRELIRETEDMMKAVTIIKKLYKFIEMNHRYFDLPDKLFNKSTFILQYMQDRTVYDSDYLTYIIELEETYERKHELETKIEDTKEKISSLEATTEMYHNIQTQINQLSTSITDIDTMIDAQRADLEYNTKELTALESICSDINKQVDILKELESLRNEFNAVKSELSIMESKMGDIETARSRHKEYELKQSQIESNIRECEDRLKNTQLVISTIMDLQREQRELIDKYTKDKLILEAVSPTTGIPLDFINYYIKEEMIGKVNDLLDAVYHGRLRLVKSKTVISEDEFTIPYMKRGTLVSDISKASDGEKAIISLAFSLVLLNITAGPYNILLLDEMDTTLDTESRAKYIELLEQFMKTINAEQLFLISHNAMFDVYPVNVIKTSPSNVNMKNAQIKDLTAA